MPSLDDVAGLALALPETAEGTSYGSRAWKVGGKTFVWERPFRKADLRRLADEGVEAPDGVIIGVAVDDLVEKEAILGLGRPGFFTISHFDGYSALLVNLDDVADSDLEEAIIDAWLCSAPAALAERFLAEQESGS